MCGKSNVAGFYTGFVVIVRKFWGVNVRGNVMGIVNKKPGACFPFSKA